MFLRILLINRYLKGVVIVLVSSFLSGCEPPPKQPSPPVDVSITLDRGGEIVDFEVYLYEDYFYTFGVKYFIDENKYGDAGELLKLIESGGGRQQVLVDIHLQVWAVNADQSSLVFDNTVSVIDMLEGGGSYLKKIAQLKLSPGIYRVKAENKIARPEFADRKVTIHVKRAYMGK